MNLTEAKKKMGQQAMSSMLFGFEPAKLNQISPQVEFIFNSKSVGHTNTHTHF